MEGVRPADFGDVRAEYDALVTGAGVLDRSHLTKLVVSGSERFQWLQGQITNDLRRLEPGGYLDFFVCTPTGQVVADCRVWDMDDRYLILAPGVQRVALVTRLNRMLISEDIEIEDVSQEYALLSLIGPDAHTIEVELPTRPSSALRIAGRDVLVPAENSLDFVNSLVGDARPVGETAYAIARIEDAIPLFGKDIDERTLPQELGPLAERRFISYSKGCYTGQETIMRIHSRGHTNKTWVGIRANRELSPGESVDDAGPVRSACHSMALGGPIALATLKNEFTAPGTRLSVGEVVELPFVTR